MRLVIDAGVAVEIALAGGALAGLAGHELVAPILLLSEAASVLHELAWRGVVPPAHGRTAVRHLVAIPVRLVSGPGHYERSWEVADALGWARTYDAEYLAMAIDESIPLVTLDRRLQRGAERMATILGPRDVPPA